MRAFYLDVRQSAPITVCIDEVQKVPALLDVVQVRTDDRLGRFRFLLSGSSARKFRRGHANLLPGRIHRYDLHPLLEHELGDHCAIEVKSTRQISRTALSGLISFGERSKRVTRKIVVFLGSQKQQIGDVEILPLRTFLKELPN